jgi:hypothetical protein
MILNIKVNEVFDGITIKDFLKEYHVGKGKIEEIRANKLVTLNSKIVSLEEKIHKGDMKVETQKKWPNMCPTFT